MKLDLTRTMVLDNLFHYVENTHSRSNPVSRVFAVIPQGTMIGPVMEVRIVKILGQPGLEIAIPSTHITIMKRHLT